ncbi:unnamed protein product [Lymnaea stagnalis]|uniref:Uncharacterized protein n=1 Tax=Lymnaea stagnalis TaxID=6523 RepID=A0AAV2HZ94_LYMST
MALKISCPSQKPKCCGGAKPGYCLNTLCPNHEHKEIVFTQHPDVEKQLQFERLCLEEAKRKVQKQERYEFLKQERKLVGMKEPDEEEMNKVSLYANKVDIDDTEQQKPKSCPTIDLRKIKTPEKKSMRIPARKACMLEVPHYSPPVDDYNDLSNFLRISTMPGYSNSNTVSQYQDTHNMSVWNNRKDIDRQAYKMRKDWLSVWSEYNVVEQHWRKDWAEKFSGTSAK